MALINCGECSKEISDQAVACPGCGAPISKSPASLTREEKRTSKSTWAVLVLIVVGVFFFTQSRSYKEQSLLPLPIEVGFRNALTGPGMVLQIKNTSSQNLTALVTITNPTMQQEKSFRVDVPAQSTYEIGHKEGWILAHGDRLKLFNDQFQTWSGSIP